MFPNYSYASWILYACVNLCKFVLGHHFMFPILSACVGAHLCSILILKYCIYSKHLIYLGTPWFRLYMSGQWTVERSYTSSGRNSFVATKIVGHLLYPSLSLKGLGAEETLHSSLCWMASSVPNIIVLMTSLFASHRNGCCFYHTILPYRTSVLGSAGISIETHQSYHHYYLPKKKQYVSTICL
ncbi:hypothetical protein BS78_08G092400 [Paspalum vaginatum]|nr:hypothetical protein BS78_08G092400 [Paspalum vaginatum]